MARPAGLGRTPARHEMPAIDAAAMTAARWADRLLAAAEERHLERWEAFLAPVPDRLRDGELRDLRSVALRARAAYGAKDSIRDALPDDLVEPFRDALDALLKALARQQTDG